MQRGSALEGFAALYDGTGNESAVVPCRISCRVTVEYELVRLFQARGGGVCRGKPLGRLPELWPFDLLKRPLVEEAQEFVRQVGLQGWRPLTPATFFEVWGPFTEKVGTPHDWVPEADNPFIPDHEKQVATTAWLYAGHELRVDKGCAFFIRGEFARKATLGSIDEERGLILV